MKVVTICHQRDTTAVGSLESHALRHFLCDCPLSTAADLPSADDLTDLLRLMATASRKRSCPTLTKFQIQRLAGAHVWARGLAYISAKVLLGMRSVKYAKFGTLRSSTILRQDTTSACLFRLQNMKTAFTWTGKIASGRAALQSFASTGRTVQGLHPSRKRLPLNTKRAPVRHNNLLWTRQQRAVQ